LNERVHVEDLGVQGTIILKLTLKMYNGRAWSELVWLRIGTLGGLL